jgi:cell division protein FtsB
MNKKQKPNKHNAKVRIARRMITRAEEKAGLSIFGCKQWFIRSMVRAQRELRKTRAWKSMMKNKKK